MNHLVHVWYSAFGKAEGWEAHGSDSRLQICQYHKRRNLGAGRSTASPETDETPGMLALASRRSQRDARWVPGFWRSPPCASDSTESGHWWLLLLYGQRQQGKKFCTKQEPSDSLAHADSVQSHPICEHQQRLTGKNVLCWVPEQVSVLVAGFLDDAEQVDPPPETEQEVQPSSPPPSQLTAQQVSSLPTSRRSVRDALARALELYEITNAEATQAEWWEAALLYDAVEDVSLLQNGGQHWPTLSLCITTEQGNSLQLHVETRQLPVVAHKHQAHDGPEELEPCSVPLADELGKVGCCNPFSTAQLYSPECPGSLSEGERQDTMFSSSSKRLTWQIQHRKIWLAWMQAASTVARGCRRTLAGPARGFWTSRGSTGYREITWHWPLRNSSPMRRQPFRKDMGLTWSFRG